MQKNNPLNKVVFIQKVASFTKTKSPLKDLFRLAYVNNSWNDTIKNYTSHVFEKQLRAVATARVLEGVCVRVIKCGVPWFVEVLVSCKTVMDRINVLKLVCEIAPSMDLMTLVFDKTFKVGGKDMFERHITATDYQGTNCLMFCCSNSSSLEVMELVFAKIDEVGGTELLKSQISATNNCGENCLMHCCSNRSSTPEVMKLLFEKLVEVGGAALLEDHLSEKDSSHRNCLMLCCHNASAASSREVMKLVAAALFQLGLFQEQCARLGSHDKKLLTEIKAGIYSSYSAEVNEILQADSFPKKKSDESED